MRETIVSFMKTSSALVIGGLIALILAPLVIQSTQMLRDWYDHANPPAIAKVISHERIKGDTLRIRFEIQRRRECDFLRLVGFTGQDKESLSLATTIQREDGSPPVSYPSGIRVLSQPWIIHPVNGPHTLVIAYYDCDGEEVRTRLIDQVLK